MKWLSALLFFLGSAMPLAAQESQAPSPSAVVVRQSADPVTGVVVGQRVALYVDVLFRGEMPRPPRVSLPDVPGVQAFRFETQGVTMRESIDGDAYVGQRFEFALYARRGGRFDVPPAKVTLLDREGGEAGHAQGQALQLDVTVPPGIDASQPVVATRRLTLTEQWDPVPTGRFKAGDALVRTLSRSAEDVPGLAMRDLAFPAPEGVRVYADPPDIEDRSNRGVVTGHRIDRVTYVLERGGSFVLPAVTQPWWDLGSRESRIAEAAAATISVAAPAAPAADAAAARWERRYTVLTLIGAAGLLALAWGMRLLVRWKGARRVDPERAAFAALRRACAGVDATTIYRCFSAWMPLLPPTQQKAAQRSAAGLRAALFACPAREWGREDSTRLLSGLQSLRGTSRHARTIPALPPLNPASSASSGRQAARTENYLGRKMT